MTRRDLAETVLFVVLVSAGSALRIVLSDLPNFAPVAAMALFAGYFFRSRLVACAVPVSVMILSDWVIGAYSWQMMLLVYSMLVFPVALRAPLRRYLAIRADNSAIRSVLGLLTCSLGAALAFFLVTNFGSWIWFDSYAPGWAGLLQCYAAALPFFRYTLLGDFVFGCLLFGGHALATRLGWAGEVVIEPAA